MAAKKKAATKKRAPKKEPTVEGTPRTHRAVDAEQLRENIKQRKTNGVYP